jgi:integrase
MSYEKVPDVRNVYERNGRNYLKRKIKGKVSWIPLAATTLRDIELEVAEYTVQHSSKTPAKRNVRMDDAYDRFIEIGHGSRGVLAPSTSTEYESVYRLFAQKKLGRMRVADVSPEHILEVREVALRVSEGRWRHLYVALNSFFEKVTEPGVQYVRGDNPVRSIGMSMRPHQEQVTPVADEAILSNEEIDKIIEQIPESVEGYKVKTILQLLPETGMRINESLGLSILDIIYEKGHLHSVDDLPVAIKINRQLGFRFKSGDPTTWFAPAKGRHDISGSQARTVGLSPYAARILRDYIKRGHAEGWLKTTAEIDMPLLFPNSKGRPMRSNHIWAHLQNAANDAGVRKVTLHWLRHTFASTQAENGTELKDLREALGHSSDAVTEKRYKHRTEKAGYISAIAKGGRQ